MVVIGMLDLLVIAVGISGVLDLRELRTPAGVARTYVEAGRDGDCERYLGLLTAAERARETAFATAPEHQVVPQVAQAKTPEGKTCALAKLQFRGVTVTGTQITDRSGDTAVARVAVTLNDRAQTLQLELARVGGDWLVAGPAPRVVSSSHGAPLTLG
jgi:hypothetical protein